MGLIANLFAFQVSTVGVTGTRTNVSTKVQSLLQDVKQVGN
jgi:tryptophan synthase alpha subunit